MRYIGKGSSAVGLLSLLFLFCTEAHVENIGTDAKPQRKIESDRIFAQFEDAAGLPRVLLIGDSISIGYTLPTRRLLHGKANVHRIPMNGGPTTRVLEMLTEWLRYGKWDVIHFNWGLHDLEIMEDGEHQVPIDQYEKNLRDLVEQLKST